MKSTRLGTLLPNTLYEIRIMGTNKVGIGEASDIISFSTLQEGKNRFFTKLILFICLLS